MDEVRIGALGIGVVRVDRGGTIADANDWFAEWIGRASDELVGRSIDEFLTHSQDDLLPGQSASGPWMLLDTRAPGRALMATRQHDGDEDVFILSEASERWNALADLRSRYALADRTRTRLQLVMDSSVAFATATTEVRLAEILADTTTRAYRAEETAVYLHKPGGPSELVAGRDPFDGAVDAEALVQLVVDPRQVVRIVGEDDAERAIPGLGVAMTAAGVRALIAAPLHHEEVDFGAFVSWFHHERTFDDEAAPLAEALANQAAQAVATLRLQARLAHAATHDDVTGLPNRRLLEAQMGAMMGGAPCAAIFIDLDGFKAVNDRLGHQAGDRMLRDAGERLISGVRGDDLIARYGGDEFVIACEVADSSVAMDVAQRILALLHGDPEHPERSRPLRASIGVAVAPAGTGLLAEQLIRRADLAMYRAKSSGGDRIVLAED
ncbi:diguanylate cyclase [Microbacterium sp.]|uniref:diguanylate cyclase n=1 Tax=Microbacterium sp. TaxID=51671 RepID=UPI0035B368D9